MLFGLFMVRVRVHHIINGIVQLLCVDDKIDVEINGMHCYNIALLVTHAVKINHSSIWQFCSLFYCGYRFLILVYLFYLFLPQRLYGISKVELLQDSKKQK